MHPDNLERLNNYRTLVARTDEICRRIEEGFRGLISCRRGCDECCRHLSLFPVEGMALTAALATLPAGEAERICGRARDATPDGPCPLLEDGACLLYQARPLICRTHGLPLLTNREGVRTVDFCPRNFRDLKSLPGSAVIDLDRLNETLAAVNLLFEAEVPGEKGLSGRRITIAEALLAEW